MLKEKKGVEFKMSRRSDKRVQSLFLARRRISVRVHYAGVVDKLYYVHT